MSKQERSFWTLLRVIENKADKYGEEAIAVVVAALTMAIQAGNKDRLAEHCLAFQETAPGLPFDILASVRVKGGDDAGFKSKR